MSDKGTLERLSTALSIKLEIIKLFSKNNCKQQSNIKGHSNGDSQCHFEKMILKQALTQCQPLKLIRKLNLRHQKFCLKTFNLSIVP